MKKGVARKAIIVGLDGARPDFIRKWCGEGKLPNIRSLIQNGFFSSAIPTDPPHTTPGWASIATGAWPGTSGITTPLHIPGEPINVERYGLDPSYCKAEHIWDAASRAGKKSIILTYPGGEPVENGIHVVNWGFRSIQITPSMIFSNSYTSLFFRNLLVLLVGRSDSNLQPDYRDTVRMHNLERSSVVCWRSAFWNRFREVEPT